MLNRFFSGIYPKVCNPVFYFLLSFLNHVSWRTWIFTHFILHFIFIFCEWMELHFLWVISSHREYNLWVTFAVNVTMTLFSLPKRCSGHGQKNYSVGHMSLKDTFITSICWNVKKYKSTVNLYLLYLHNKIHDFNVFSISSTNY